MTVNSLYDKKLQENEWHAEVKAFYFREWVGYQMPEQHIHDQVEIMYVINGTCCIEIMDHRFLLKKNDAILIDADVSHRLKVDPDTHCRMLNIEFGFKRIQTGFPSMKSLAKEVNIFTSLLAQKKPFYLLRDSDEISQTLRDLILELNDRSAANDFVVQLYIAEIMIKISKIVSNNSTAKDSVNAYTKKTLAYMSNNYDRRIQVSDIASHVKINVAYLQRIFKAQTGQTLIEYLTSLRVEKAKELLAYTNIPIIDISDYVGMSNRQYFTYVFKKHTGKSPARYRKDTVLL